MQSTYSNEIEYSSSVFRPSVFDISATTDQCVFFRICADGVRLLLTFGWFREFSRTATNRLNLKHPIRILSLFLWFGILFGIEVWASIYDFCVTVCTKLISTKSISFETKPTRDIGEKCNGTNCYWKFVERQKSCEIQNSQSKLIETEKTAKFIVRRNVFHSKWEKWALEAEKKILEIHWFVHKHIRTHEMKREKMREEIESI